MTDKATAIRALIEKMEAGKCPILHSDKWHVISGGEQLYADFAFRAFYGSLDAAKRLHEAVLPGREELAVYLHNDNDPIVWSCDFYSDAQTVASSENQIAARAWLLAILRALLAKEPAQ